MPSSDSSTHAVSKSSIPLRRSIRLAPRHTAATDSNNLASSSLTVSKSVIVPPAKKPLTVPRKTQSKRTGKPHTKLSQRLLNKKISTVPSKTISQTSKSKSCSSTLHSASSPSRLLSHPTLPINVSPFSPSHSHSLNSISPLPRTFHPSFHHPIRRICSSPILFSPPPSHIPLHKSSPHTPHSNNLLPITTYPQISPTAPLRLPQRQHSSPPAVFRSSHPRSSSDLSLPFPSTHTFYKIPVRSSPTRPLPLTTHSSVPSTRSVRDSLASAVSIIDDTIDTTLNLTSRVISAAIQPLTTRFTASQRPLFYLDCDTPRQCPLFTSPQFAFFPLAQSTSPFQPHATTSEILHAVSLPFSVLPSPYPCINSPRSPAPNSLSLYTVSLDNLVLYPPSSLTLHNDPIFQPLPPPFTFLSHPSLSTQPYLSYAFSLYHTSFTVSNLVDAYTNFTLVPQLPLLQTPLPFHTALLLSHSPSITSLPFAYTLTPATILHFLATASSQSTSDPLLAYYCRNYVLPLRLLCDYLTFVAHPFHALAFLRTYHHLVPCVPFPLFAEQFHAANPPSIPSSILRFLNFIASFDFPIHPLPLSLPVYLHLRNYTFPHLPSLRRFPSPLASTDPFLYSSSVSPLPSSPPFTVRFATQVQSLSASSVTLLSPSPPPASTPPVSNPLSPSYSTLPSSSQSYLFTSISSFVSPLPSVSTSTHSLPLLDTMAQQQPPSHSGILPPNPSASSSSATNNSSSSNTASFSSNSLPTFEQQYTAQRIHSTAQTVPFEPTSTFTPSPQRPHVAEPRSSASTQYFDLGTQNQPPDASSLDLTHDPFFSSSYPFTNPRLLNPNQQPLSFEDVTAPHPRRVNFTREDCDNFCRANPTQISRYHVDQFVNHLNRMFQNSPTNPDAMAEAEALRQLSSNLHHQELTPLIQLYLSTDANLPFAKTIFWRSMSMQYISQWMRPPPERYTLATALSKFSTVINRLNTNNFANSNNNNRPRFNASNSSNNFFNNNRVRPTNNPRTNFRPYNNSNNNFRSFQNRTTNFRNNNNNTRLFLALPSSSNRSSNSFNNSNSTNRNTGYTPAQQTNFNHNRQNQSPSNRNNGNTSPSRPPRTNFNRNNNNSSRANAITIDEITEDEVELINQFRAANLDPDSADGDDPSADYDANANDDDCENAEINAFDDSENF